MAKKKVIRKKITQDDFFRLSGKAVEAVVGERELSDATVTSMQEDMPQFQENIQSGQSRGGEKAAKKKRSDNEERNADIRNKAKKLEANGKQKREIPSIISELDGINLGRRQISRILKDE